MTQCFLFYTTQIVNQHIIDVSLIRTPISNKTFTSLKIFSSYFLSCSLQVWGQSFYQLMYHKYIVTQFNCLTLNSSWVCITVLNSPNPSRVYIRLCKHRKKGFYCFYKITLPRKKTQKPSVIALIKTEILTSPKVLYTKPCTHNQFSFCKKLLSKIWTLAKKFDTTCLLRFPKFQPTKEWVNKVTL